MPAYVKNGTPLHGPPLCESCVRAHIERGYREDELSIVCQATYPDHRVRFRVRECSGYLQTRRQSLEQMEDMAWLLMPRDGKRVAGFVRPSDTDGEHSIEIEIERSK